VDIDEATYNMDPGLLEKAITPRTKAIIPVHLFGQCADMDAILEIAGRHGLAVIEDACQAHGATYKGRKAGTMGAAGCFSFYPGKNLGALGEAGATVTNNAELAGKIQVLRDHGQARKYYHSHIGWNGRMDGIQAAVLSVKLKQLDASNLRRRSHALLYDQLLGGTQGVIIPAQGRHNESIYHIYAVRVKDRDRVLQSMAEKGISCAIHYPIPVHLQEAYRFLGQGKGSFPVAERCVAEFLSLPMFPELSREQVLAVAEELKTCLRAARPLAGCAQ
jgi:dTDP-4-amino-4,6-dideoxygalactose transaminase